jgi:hypothetical protein
MVAVSVFVVLVLLVGAVGISAAAGRGMDSARPRAPRRDDATSDDRRLGSFIGHVMDTADHKTTPRSVTRTTGRAGTDDAPYRAAGPLMRQPPPDHVRAERNETPSASHPLA